MYLSWWLHSPIWPHISIRWRFTTLIVNSPVSKQHREVNWRAMRGKGDSPPGVTELGNVGVPSICLFVFFKIVYRFKSQIHWLTWLRWSRAPLFWGTNMAALCLSQGGQFTNSPPHQQHRGLLWGPWLSTCLAGLPAWRRVKRLSWTWRMEPCTEWPVGYVERAWS